MRRELWENRSIYIAPLIAAGVVLFGFANERVRIAGAQDATLLLPWNPRAQRAAIEMPYDIAAMMIMFTVFIVGIFYCLDALHGERRDRSILFWKSLPVSDLTTVLSKVIVPLVILPAITFAITLVTQLTMLLLSTAVLLPQRTGWNHMESFTLAPAVDDSPLWPRDQRPLGGADLRLAAPGLQLGQARDVSLGGAAHGSQSARLKNSRSIPRFSFTCSSVV